MVEQRGTIDLTHLRWGIFEVTNFNLNTEDNAYEFRGTLVRNQKLIPGKIRVTSVGLSNPNTPGGSSINPQWVIDNPQQWVNANNVLS